MVAVTLPVLRLLMPMSPEPPELAVKVEGVKPASTWMVPAPAVATCKASQVLEGCLKDLWHLAALPPHIRWRPAGPFMVLALPATTCRMCQVASAEDSYC